MNVWALPEQDLLDALERVEAGETANELLIELLSFAELVDVLDDE